MKPWAEVPEDLDVEKEDATKDDSLVPGADSTAFLSDSGPENSPDVRKDPLVRFIDWEPQKIQKILCDGRRRLAYN